MTGYVKFAPRVLRDRRSLLNNFENDVISTIGLWKCESKCGNVTLADKCGSLNPNVDLWICQFISQYLRTVLIQLWKWRHLSDSSTIFNRSPPHPKYGHVMDSSCHVIKRHLVGLLASIVDPTAIQHFPYVAISGYTDPLSAHLAKSALQAQLVKAASAQACQAILVCGTHTCLEPQPLGT